MLSGQMQMMDKSENLTSPFKSVYSIDQILGTGTNKSHRGNLFSFSYLINQLILSLDIDFDQYLGR